MKKTKQTAPNHASRARATATFADAEIKLDDALVDVTPVDFAPAKASKRAKLDASVDELNALNAEYRAAAVWLPIGLLKPWPDNPRVLDEPAIARVAESMKRFGFGTPILAREQNHEIIAGHARWLAAQRLNMGVVPVRLLRIDEAEAHALALADNRYTELTQWSGSLGDVLAQLPVEDVGFLGWTADELARATAHLISEGTSAEVDLDALGAEVFAHKCPQCGCEYNE